MRLVPVSLNGRLLAAAAVLVAVLIAVAAVVIAGILGHFVRLQLDNRLDAQIVAVAGSLRMGPGNSLRVDPVVDAPPFDRPNRGWYWQAQVNGRVLASRALDGERLAVAGEAPPAERARFDFMRPWPAEIEGPRGETLIARAAIRIVDGQPATILATAPREAFMRPLLDALIPVTAAMLVLGLVLFAALILQVRLGLRPLQALRNDLRAIEEGRAGRLPEASQPVEVRPLAAAINTLLQRNEAGLERARRHVANLAHGLKTPLARLSVALQEEGRDPDAAIAPLIGAMDRLIRHHLARARTAALANAHRSRTDLAPRLDDLALAMRRIHAERGVACERTGAGTLVVACEAQDCDELFGNLLDNAFRHAASLVRVELRLSGALAVIVVADDGPGMPEDVAEEALRPGRRLDESSPGYGFGLPIAREIAELYGGDLLLARSDLGGLAVSVTVPRADDGASPATG